MYIIFFKNYYAIAICNDNTREHPNNKSIAQTTILAITITKTTQTTTLTMMMTTQQQLTRTTIQTTVTMTTHPQQLKQQH